MDYKISKEVAQEQFKMFAEYHEVDFDGLPPDQKAAMEVLKDRIIKAIRQGRLEVEENGRDIVQTLKIPVGEVTSFKYHGRFIGKGKIAMGDKKETDTYGRIYALLGAMSSLGAKAIGGLENPDLKVAEALGSLFL